MADTKLGPAGPVTHRAAGAAWPRRAAGWLSSSCSHLGERLTGRGFRFGIAGCLALAAGLYTFGDGRGDHAVSGAALWMASLPDRVVDEVGVAVGVEDGDHRDVELMGLADGDVLLVGVDDPDGRGHRWLRRIPLVPRACLFYA